MYAQLGDHQKTSNSSSSTSSQISPSASSSDHNHVKKIDGKLKLGPRKKNKNLDLQQSLMGDVEMNGSKIESIEDQSQKSNLRSNGNHSNGLHSQYENNAVGENNGSSSSMMVSDDDPFYVFKDDLEIKLEMLDDGLQRFERIVQVTVSTIDIAIPILLSNLYTSPSMRIIHSFIIFRPLVNFVLFMSTSPRILPSTLMK